jgi:hypothetical protein
MAMVAMLYRLFTPMGMLPINRENIKMYDMAEPLKE